LWEDDDPIPHISLADWADLVVIAPATSNTIAKAVAGISDILLSSILLAHTKPVLWVPAMNVNMYQNPVTQRNLAILAERRHHVLDPATGLLACAYTGKGKYPPNIEIVYPSRLI
jgi:phosphopantothenoylcysteine decarboxylase/phosphopantothenate--cysteine ligase